MITIQLYRLLEKLDYSALQLQFCLVTWSRYLVLLCPNLGGTYPLGPQFDAYDIVRIAEDQMFFAVSYTAGYQLAGYTCISNKSMHQYGL